MDRTAGRLRRHGGRDASLISSAGVPAEPWQMTAGQLASALRSRQLTAVEALESVLGRADTAAGWVNPYAVRLDQRAREAARRADVMLADGRGGRLCGVPLTTKDSQWIAGVESSVGSLTQTGFVPTQTAIPIERLDASGAVIFATTTTPEFCYAGVCTSQVHGVTANPWSTLRTPGGSSGGAAAAVAARAGTVALGGDGGGSIRIPAAFCGVVGFKPTFGAVPREPCGPAWKTLVSVGPLSRTVADAYMLFATVAGVDARDRHSTSVELAQAAVEPERLRLVVSLDRGGTAPVDADVTGVLEGVIAELEAAGVTIIRDDPEGVSSSARPWAIIAAADGWQEHAATFEQERGGMELTTVEFLEFGAGVTIADYLWARNQRERIHHAYVELLHRHDAQAVITPTLGCEAFPADQRYPGVIGGVAIEPPWLDWAGFLPDANLAGFPACAVPIGFGDEQLPVSVQVSSLRGKDTTVLAIAALIERAAAFAASPMEPVPEPSQPAPIV